VWRRQTAAIRFRVSWLRREKQSHDRELWGGMKRTGWQELQEGQDGFLDRINRIYRIGREGGFMSLCCGKFCEFC
jgi:hypothetical protein